MDDVLTHFDDDHHDGLSSLSSSSSSSISTPTPTPSALPIPDAASSTSHLSPPPDVPFVAEDGDNEDEDIEEVDRALAVPLGAEYTTTEEEGQGEEEETWEDAWEELMPLDVELDGVSARSSSSSSSAAAAVMRQPEGANEETLSTSSEKPQEQTRTSLLPASADGGPEGGEEDFEMV